ncbi:hypothetical protein INQ30_29385, partial [Escherichia coli]|nr:hypothetical protein [Escherichia coli]
QRRLTTRAIVRRDPILDPPPMQECEPMRADLSLDRFSPTRRQALLGGAAAILTAGAGREARAAAGTVVVSNWGGDWNQR